MKISEKERIELIREGNRLFNSGQVKEAGKIFQTVKYVDGLIRIGNHYYKIKQFVPALGYFRLAGYQRGIRLISREMLRVFKTWLSEGGS